MFPSIYRQSDGGATRSGLLLAATLLVVLVLIAGALPAPGVPSVYGAAATLSCKHGSKVVSKKVHGKTQRVRVCRPAPSPMKVISSIPTGAHLSQPVVWSATISGHGEAIREVDFLIDGRIRWTAIGPPYDFSGNTDYLDPWILGEGTHHLGIAVTTTSGRVARSTETVTVVDVQPVPKALLGTYQRTVTAADFARTAGEVTPGQYVDPGGNRAPTGKWTLYWMPNGVIYPVDPGHVGRTPKYPGMTEAFTATTDGKLTLYGTVNWLSASDMQWGFCEGEPFGEYHWQARGSSQLVIAPSKADVKCPDRDSVFTGTWSRVKRAGG